MSDNRELPASSWTTSWFGRYGCENPFISTIVKVIHIDNVDRLVENILVYPM